MINTENDLKKEKLSKQNEELKTQIELIKKKIDEFKSSEHQKLSKRLLNPTYTNKYFSSDSEMIELNKKIEYYSGETSKKKYQIEKLLSISKINSLQAQFKEENIKVRNLQTENDALMKVYNNQMKGINRFSFIYDMTSEEKLNDKIQQLKVEHKELESSNKKIDEELKEQRIVYSDLNETINKIKCRIKQIKSELKTPSIKRNYNEEIRNIEREIEKEQEKLQSEEIEYKEIIRKNEDIINQLTEEIIRKREMLKDKGNVFYDL